MNFDETAFLFVLWISFVPGQASNLPTNWRSLIADDTFAYSVRHFQRPVASPGVPAQPDVTILEGDIRAIVPVYNQRTQNGQRFLNAVIQETQTWPRGIVPYVLDPEFSWPERDIIQEAMNDIERHTCVRFMERHTAASFVSHSDYIRLERTRGTCSSYVGRMNIGEQDVQLAPGCMKLIGEVQHELLHALGLYHEQSRMDRDEHVYIVRENIFNARGVDLTSQFEKYESNTFGLPYDFESIMHYGHNYFSRSVHLPTIVPRSQPNQQPVRIGNRDKMTDIDSQKISYLYKCLYISYEGAPSTIAPPHVHHITRRRHQVHETTTTSQPSPLLQTAGPPTSRLSSDELNRLRKNKYNESTNAWRRFKNAVKQGGNGAGNGGLYRRHAITVDPMKTFPTISGAMLFQDATSTAQKSSALLPRGSLCLTVMLSLLVGLFLYLSTQPFHIRWT